MATALVDRHPDQVFVVDQRGEAAIRDGIVSPWRERMRELGRRPNVFCKLSGMVTGADPRAWTRASLEPYAHAVLEAFGPSRVMFGSDWPSAWPPAPTRSGSPRSGSCAAGSRQRAGRGCWAERAPWPTGSAARGPAGGRSIVTGGKAMKAGVLYDERKIEVREVPDPTPRTAR